jgi:RNA polymerase sigma factor (TIGR02999 family)
MAFRVEYVISILMSDVTLILQAVGRGENEAPEELMPMVYEELRRLAAARMAHESAGHTLQPTALVHEAWLRMVRDDHRTWKNRAYFFAAAAEAMRRILVEHARRKSALKHGGGQERLNIDELELAEATTDEKLLLVDEALEELGVAHPERARVVVLKYFGGMTNQEVAETIGVSARTVNRHWLCAQAWLFERIQIQL